MYYGDKKDSLVKIQDGLRNREWSIYGFKEDMSDSMTDYFDPASWQGVAVKNGFILVIDNYAGGKIGGDFIQQSYDVKIAKRIKKLQALADNHAASKGERDNSLAMIKKFDKELVKQVTIVGDLPEVTYQKNPGNSKWHIEKDGHIIAKGTGVFNFKNVNTWREENIVYRDKDANTAVYLSYYNFDNVNTWQKHYEYGMQKNKERELLLDKYFKLLNKWEILVSIRLGDGDEEKLIQKTVKKKIVHLLAEDSDIPTEYVRVGDKYTRAAGLQEHRIYKLLDNNQHIKKLTKKWITLKDGSSINSYKAEPNKNTNVGLFHGSEKDHKEGVFVYVNLIEKIEYFDEIVYVKQKQSNNKKMKTDVNKNTKVTPVATAVLYDTDILQTFNSGVLF